MQKIRKIFLKETKCCIVSTTITKPTRITKPHTTITKPHTVSTTITKPTRITTSSATVLDHIWTNVFNSKMSSSILTDCVADHLPVILCLETNNDIQKPKKKLVQQQRNFSNDNILSFTEALKNMNTESIFHCNDVDDAYNNFISEYTKKFETCFPYT